MNEYFFVNSHGQLHNSLYEHSLKRKKNPPVEEFWPSAVV